MAEKEDVILFARWVIEQCWQASIDAGEVQDEAVRLGLIESVDEANILYCFTPIMTI